MKGAIPFGVATRAAKADVVAMEIIFPLEFTVRGTPVSLQVKRAEARSLWRERVRAASRTALPEGHFATDVPLAITLFYFPDGDMQGDIDNIVKPILDALGRHVYYDDRQVERIWVQKFERLARFSNPSAVLTEALTGPRPVLYVRLTDDTAEGFL